jgi:hypothetical protein
LGVITGDEQEEMNRKISPGLERNQLPTRHTALLPENTILLQERKSNTTNLLDW